MSSAGVAEESDAVLSDVEAEDDPVTIRIATPSEDEISVDKFRELISELDREKQARVVAENAKSELQVSFNRLKVLAHEAIKKRDESNRQKDDVFREKEEAVRANEKLSNELSEVNRVKEELLKQRDEIAKQLDDAVKTKDSSRSEVETAAQMLVSGIEKISGKANRIKNFTAGGLPRSQKYSGLPAIAYGVIKRTNEVVDELLKQIDSITQSRNEAREQVEQRNYEIAIEVSQLEATIGQLREEVSKKTSLVQQLENSIAEKEKKLSEIEGKVSERLHSAEHEGLELRKLVDEYEHKLKTLESKMESQKPLLVEQLNFVTKIHYELYNVVKIVDATNSDQSELSESLFLPQQTGLEENIRASLAGMESIYQLSRMVVTKSRDTIEEKNHDVKGLNETVARLVREKEHIGVLLRSALTKRLGSNPSSQSSEFFQVVENSSRDVGIEFKFGDQGTKEDEIYALAAALENIIKASQHEIIELKHSVEELRWMVQWQLATSAPKVQLKLMEVVLVRAESNILKEHLEAQAKDLNQRKQRIEELEAKERAANENVEGLMMDIAAAEEEITRWKMAAEQEAAAGSTVEQDYLTQLSTLKQELEEAKQAIIESEKKLKFKEETAAAAMAARDAAEKSLKLTDLRAARLRDRVEELTHQLEDLDTREETTRNRNDPRYVCWPWEWLGIDFAGVRRIDPPPQQRSNEMELSEPLI